MDSTYGLTNDEETITKYLDAHLCGGIQQKNLDKILDIIDNFIELKEEMENINVHRKY